jgi:hypothetical protein
MLRQLKTGKVSKYTQFMSSFSGRSEQESGVVALAGTSDGRVFMSHKLTENDPRPPLVEYLPSSPITVLCNNSESGSEVNIVSVFSNTGQVSVLKNRSNVTL